jgi:putative methylase
MESKRTLEKRLSQVEGFEEPNVELEQYPTPAEIASQLVHLADLQGDLDSVIVDLGTGTGMLAIGAALRGAKRVIALDADRGVLEQARTNEQRVSPPLEIDWLLGDGGRLPVSLSNATVLMNPPFGAQRDNRGADRRFLDAASEIADVIYSIHNAGSREFVESFIRDQGGEITHAYELMFDIESQFKFHKEETKTIRAECYRSSWRGT